MSTDLLYSDIEDSIRDTLRQLLTAKLDPQSVTAFYDGSTDDSGLWASITKDLGLGALLIPEEFGGAGATAREAAVVLEELGRTGAPVPFFTSAVLATTALVEAGASELLGALASGDKTAALAVPLTSMAGRTALTVSEADGRLNGTVSSVADAGTADVFVVPAASADGTVGLYLVDRGDVSIESVVAFDMSRPLGDVSFSAASSASILSGVAATNALDKSLRVGAGLLASEQLGAARWCLETTLAFVKVRYQFGRPIGSYQALKHRLADLWLEIGQCHAAARYAADCLAADSEDVEVAVSLAQAYGSDLAVRAAEEAIQMHAGIGMTWEHPAHLYLKRAKADQLAMGTPEQHRVRLATLVDLQPAVHSGSESITQLT